MNQARGGFRPGWEGSRTLSAYSNRSEYRVSVLKKAIFLGLEPCQLFKIKLTGFQNESDMYLSLILIEETSKLKVVVGARRCGIAGCTLPLTVTPHCCVNNGSHLLAPWSLHDIQTTPCVLIPTQITYSFNNYIIYIYMYISRPKLEPCQNIFWIRPCKHNCSDTLRVPFPMDAL